ncbi:ATP-binding cassette domain-containing protein [Rhodospirillaceae bacterium SYSU D60014]|uniref:ABC-F family ATP-binding cassette domain-containing protein n=1 Tax=Virgifigura deserti TaxID=2268457 RepID=UPI000E66F9B7
MPPAPPLASLRAARITFGGAPLFDGVTLSIGRGDRACLVGRNGSGKSTLLKALAGEIEIDGGERFVQPGTRIATLPQSPVFREEQAVETYVARGLPATGEAAETHYRVEAVLDRLGLEGARPLGTLSGGEGRRATLAQALVGDPDLLLLDEPTNHLDLPTIEWLEEELARFSGGLLMISHDRALLRNLSQRVLWLDRGQIRELNDGFAAFDAWSTAIIEAEGEEAHRLDRRIAAETHWLQRGVTARRKRNEGRLRRLQTLRRTRAERVKAAGRAKLALGAAETGGQLVIEAQDLGKSFPAPDGEPGGEKMILRGFSTRILRGDRIGIIGPNGAGKTTLLKLLTGDLPPDQGTVRFGTNLQSLYLDQHRAALDDQATLWQTLVPGGGDSIMVRGGQRHVVAYLRDFLFDERQALMPVASLSGGERARLLLAKLFAAPSNFVILDEPTNDLDMETLDLLQEVLDDYDGTLLLVSHDRDFLDRLVTSIIAVEGNGVAAEYPGGYSDYRRQRPTEDASRPAKKATTTGKPPQTKPEEQRPTRLSYKEQRELDGLPTRLEALETEIAELEQRLSDSGLYARDPAAFERITQRLNAANAELANAENRWLELEERSQALARSKG